MTRSKKVFIGIMIIFLGALAYASYDISRRTTFPGSKSQLKERIRKNFMDKDTVTTSGRDSVNASEPEK